MMIECSTTCVGDFFIDKGENAAAIFVCEPCKTFGFRKEKKKNTALDTVRGPIWFTKETIFMGSVLGRKLRAYLSQGAASELHDGIENQHYILVRNGSYYGCM